MKERLVSARKDQTLWTELITPEKPGSYNNSFIIVASASFSAPLSIIESVPFVFCTILAAGCCRDYASVSKLLHFGDDFSLDVGFLLKTNEATEARRK